jgi:hypothetical protein
MPTAYTPLGHYVNVTGIAMCITDRLADTTAGVPGRVCIYPGAVAWDECECGMLALTTSRIFGSETFPNEGVSGVSLAQCGLPWMVATLDITMLRCVPGTQGGTRAPSCEQLGNAAQVMYEDAFAVWQGTLCCLLEMRAQGMVAEYNMSAQSFEGPQGRCAGSTLSIQLGYIGPCC